MTVINAQYAAFASSASESLRPSPLLRSDYRRMCPAPDWLYTSFAPALFAHGPVSRLLDFEPLTMCNPDSKSVRTAFANESNANLSALCRLQTHGAKRLLHLLSRVSTGILPCLVLSSTAFASCTPPPKMRAKIEAKASAETYANLGTWFGNQKQFGCAAEAFGTAARMQPDSESYQYMWGLSLYSAGHTADAERPLRIAVHLNSSDVRPH